MPSSRGLAEHLGVSRITVTLAYADLVSSDYLTSRGGRAISCRTPRPLRPSFPTSQPRAEAVDFKGLTRRALHPGPARRTARGLGPLPVSLHLRPGGPDAFRPPELAAMRAAGPGQARLRGADHRLLRTRRPAADPGTSPHHPAPPGHRRARGRGPADPRRAECALDRRDCASGPGPPRRGGKPRLPRLARHGGGDGADGCAGGCRCPGSSGRKALMADVVFTTPSHQCPTNATMPVDRRVALLEAAEAQGFVIIEDDYEFEMSLPETRRPGAEVAGSGRAGDLRRLLLEIRLSGPAAWLSGRPAGLHRRGAGPAGLMLKHPPGHIQRTMAYFLGLGHYDALVNRMKNAYRRRRQVMAEAIAAEGLEVAGQGGFGGSSFWMRAPEGVDTEALALRLRGRRCADRTGARVLCRRGRRGTSTASPIPRSPAAAHRRGGAQRIARA